jgi:hypothetical protein
MTGQPPRAVVVTAAVLRASGRSSGPLLTLLAPIEPWTIRVSHVEGCWHLLVCVPQRYHLNKAILYAAFDKTFFLDLCAGGCCSPITETS